MVRQLIYHRRLSWKSNKGYHLHFPFLKIFIEKIILRMKEEKIIILKGNEIFTFYDQ